MRLVFTGAEYAVELQRRAGRRHIVRLVKGLTPEGFRCRLSDYRMVFTLSVDELGGANVFGTEGEGYDGVGTCRTVTKSQVNEASQILKCIQEDLNNDFFYGHYSFFASGLAIATRLAVGWMKNAAASVYLEVLSNKQPLRSTFVTCQTC
jgi:hypothetical protein